MPVRLAARLLDPEAFVICSCMLKTHNTVVATLSIKNMALGAPLHSARKETPRWNDKRLYHGGVRQTHVDIMLTAQRMQPFWGAAVIDGYEGMEGNGPNNGTLVPSRLAIASTDYVAADRVGIEAMGIDAAWVGYLGYCAQCGLGQNDLVQDRHPRRQARRRDQEVPPALRHAARAQMDGPHDRGPGEARLTRTSLVPTMMSPQTVG